jgi:hypothetical protein
MQNKTAQRASIIIGVIMLLAMSMSVFLPLIRTDLNTVAVPTEAPTPLPSPTPPPTPNVVAMQFDQLFLHPSGLFTVADPTGWAITNTTNNDQEAKVTMINESQISVIEASVATPPTSIQSLDDVSAYYTTALLNKSWENYTSSIETGRIQRDDKLLIDFELRLGTQTLLARHVAWFDDQWIYAIRVVMPENARDALLAMIDSLTPTLQPEKLFPGTPFGWDAYFDNQDKHIIRFPADWTVTDSAPGLPASIQGTDTTLRVASEAGKTADDESAARTWVETAHSGATIQSVNPVERNGVSGFAVSYQFSDLDGNPLSGLAVLLNGADKLHVADLRFPGSGIDLNNLGDTPDTLYSSYAQVMDTFQLVPQLNVTATGPSAQG